MIRHTPAVLDDPQLHHWGDFFVRAGLCAVLTFEEFYRDPRGCLDALTNPRAAPPKAVPDLQERLRNRIAWGTA